MNNVLVYRRDHPGNRSSYGVAGVPGLVVIHHSLFAGFGTEGFVPPTQIEVSCALSEPRADKRSEKAAERAAKADERAKKAIERAELQRKKLAEFEAKHGVKLGTTAAASEGTEPEAD